MVVAVVVLVVEELAIDNSPFLFKYRLKSNHLYILLLNNRVDFFLFCFVWWNNSQRTHHHFCLFYFYSYSWISRIFFLCVCQKMHNYFLCVLLSRIENNRIIIYFMLSVCLFLWMKCRNYFKLWPIPKNSVCVLVCGVNTAEWMKPTKRKITDKLSRHSNSFKLWEKKRKKMFQSFAGT